MNKQEKYANLADFGKELLNSNGYKDGLSLIATYATSIISAERCSIFVYDKQTGELWTTLADGIERIVIDMDKGVVGRSLQTNQLIIENNVESSQYFLAEIDENSGFKTKNIIVCPIVNKDKKAVGALELLNKESDFNDEDAKFMQFFSNFISTYIDLVERDND